MMAVLASSVQSFYLLPDMMVFPAGRMMAGSGWRGCSPHHTSGFSPIRPTGFIKEALIN
ncbi:hypothetical protein [Mariprofundus erugo]|uniref:hypothetical protein n=1 Tax=Mariprofundus erugo TaxID=2528639 RepID=UPI00137548DC|nr:hypothetical protein [Mariprofundus erugo]